jgi:phosphoribosylglycinamide formyltransferase 1
MPANLGVFASGGGTNLQALLDHFHAGASDLARVKLVVGSRGGIGALARAVDAGVATAVVDVAALAPAAVGAALLQLLDEHAIDVVVLAGYMKLVPEEVVRRYQGRILNIHPALLPAFGGPGMYGIRVHRAVLASGARVSGATVHLVDERYDEGRIVAQWPVPVLPGDTPETLAARVLDVEHLLLPAAVEALLGGAGGDPRPEVGSFALTAAPVPPPDQVRRLTR